MFVSHVSQFLSGEREGGRGRVDEMQSDDASLALRSSMRTNVSDCVKGQKLVI